MSEQLEPCPFCGLMPAENLYRYGCPYCGIPLVFSLEHWNSRSVKDGLGDDLFQAQERIAGLTMELDDMREAWKEADQKAKETYRRETGLRYLIREAAEAWKDFDAILHDDVPDSEVKPRVERYQKAIAALVDCD